MGVKNIIGELQVNGSPVITEETMGEVSSFSGSYNDLTNIPTEFNPSEHTHAIADVTGLQDNLDLIENNIGALIGDYSKGLSYMLNDDGTYRVSGIGTCTDIDIIIPSVYNGVRVTSIANSTFNGRNLITSVIIPNSVTSIGYDAFSGCSNLTSITIPNSVTSIGYGAFHNCSNLTSITIPNSVTSIGSSAFSGCSSLTSITISDSVTSISGSTFNNCSSLTSITIPDGVTSIGYQAFRNCSNLTSINIPDSVTSIGNYAFDGCSSLTSVVIPDSVTSIGNDVFSPNTIHLYCETTSQPEGWSTMWNANNCPVTWGFANDFISINEKIGDISIALDELHTYAQSIVGGAE